MAQLPPLNALRAFDAAARHLSFTAAGESLFVTHGAISRQVQQLEAFFGQPLFRRLPRGLELTNAGRELAHTTQRLFNDLTQTVSDLRRQQGNHIITVSTVASFAARWLVPRLSRFQTRNPEYEVRVGTTTALTNFSRDGVDVAFRYGSGNWPGLHSERLFCPYEFPVCAPHLLRGKNALRQPNDLANFTLLHDMTHGHWEQWLKTVGADQVDWRAGLVLEDRNVLLQAAIEGQGVALSSSALVQADINAGRLVKLFDVEIPVELSFYMVCEETRAEDSQLIPFFEWIREESKPFQVRCDGD